MGSLVIGLHLTHSFLEGSRVIRLNLVNVAHNTIVSVEVLAVTFESAALADNFGPSALLKNMCKVSLYTLVNKSVSALVNAWNLLSAALSSMLKRLIEAVLRLAVLFRACNDETFQFSLL